jgi:anti-anti-sigma factor
MTATLHETARDGKHQNRAGPHVPGSLGIVRRGRSPSRIFLELRGELDLATAGLLARRLAALPEDADVEVDVRRLAFMDLSGLRVLIVHARRGGGSVRLRGARGEVAVLLREVRALAARSAARPEPVPVEPRREPARR